MTELAQTSLTDYIAALAARKSTPGGGSVAAITAAQAAALIQMVANFSSDSDDLPDAGQVIERVINNATRAREQFLLLAEQDMVAFQQVMQAYRGKDEAALQAALAAAAGVPITVIEGCVALLEDVTLIARIGNQKLSTDTAIAADLLASAIRSSELNVLINLKQISDPAVKDGLKHSLKDVAATLDALAAIVGGIKQSFGDSQAER